MPLPHTQLVVEIQSVTGVMPFQDVSTAVEVEKQKSEAELRSDPRESTGITNDNTNERIDEVGWK